MNKTNCKKLYKSKYMRPKIEYVKFKYADVICTSGKCYGPGSTPHLDTTLSINSNK